MRKIRLSDTDGALFDEEMVPQDYEYLAKHKATFCRMWTEQGRKFWKRYVEVFRSYILRYSLLGDLTCDASQLQGTLEFAFVVITTNFIDGKANQAKSLLNQIADLGKNRHRFVHLDSKSVIKDPFYTKETRDIFREFFGPANEKSSYIRVYLLTPVYMKFGGSIVRCLSKWMEAEELFSDDDSYYIPPAPIETNTPFCSKHARPAPSPFNSVLCAYHVDDCKKKFYEQFVRGMPNTPVNLNFWEKKDPRFCEPENPLWNPGANDTSDWRDGLTIEKFQEFYAWCSFNDAIVKHENQCQDCRARRKAKKKNKKKKKKTGSTMTDFGYDDISFAVGSEESLPGSHKGKSKVVTVAKVCELKKGESIKLVPDDDWVEVDNPEALLGHINKNNTSRVDSACHATIGMSNVYTTIAVVSNGHVECQCPWCQHIKQGLQDLDLAADADPLSESAESTFEKLMEKEKLKTMESNRMACVRKPLFGENVVVKKRRDAMKLPVAGGGDLRAQFEIKYRSDPERGSSETSVTLVDVDHMPGLCKSTADAKVLKYDGPVTLGKEDIPSLTARFLTLLIPGLPLLYYTEGDDWCLFEVDYQTVEMASGNQKPSHFAVMISDALDLHLAKALTIELLRYVSRRKKRPSLGWVMNEDDIFTFCQTLGLDNFQLQGVTISIFTGGSIQDILTPDELQVALSRSRQKTDGCSNIRIESEASKTKKKTKKNKNKNKDQAKENEETNPKTNPEKNSETVSETAATVPTNKGQADAESNKTDTEAKKKDTKAHKTDTKTDQIKADVENQSEQMNKAEVSSQSQSKSESKTSDVDKTPVGGSGLVNGGGDASQTISDTRSFSHCSNCGIKEPALRSFKKCQRCKDEGVSNARYYCGRPCQQTHWKSVHSQEHSQGKLH